MIFYILNTHYIWDFIPTQCLCTGYTNSFLDKAQRDNADSRELDHGAGGAERGRADADQHPVEPHSA